MLWRRSDFDPASVTHRDAKLLAAPEIMASGLEAFKAEIVQRVERANAPKKLGPLRDAATDINVFVNAAAEDRAIAERLQEEFTRLGCTAFLPVFDGDARELRDDLDDKIVWCDALTLVYGEAQPRWISSQAMAYSKLKRKRAEPARIVLICRAAPQPKPQHGVAMPELREIDYTVGAPDDPISRVVAELRG
jgi:hypothetical protein